MKSDIQHLLHRWHEGSLTVEEMRALTVELAQPEARAALRRNWFLEAALPQSLAASSVIVRTPQPSWLARLRAWLMPQESEPLLALRWWAHASLAAAVVIGISAAVVLPKNERRDAEADSIAQIIFQRHFATSAQP